MVRRFILVLLLACACASIPLKQKAVVGLQASETFLEASHDLERALCAPAADKTKPITHCDGPQAATLGLTDARHQAIARAYIVAFDAQIKAAAALMAWKAGDPVPSTVGEYQADLAAGLGLLRQLFPATEPTVAKLQAALDEAAKVAALLGVQ